MDSAALSALSLLLLPVSTSSPAAGANSTFISRGVLPANSHFTIDKSTLTQLSNFGGFSQIRQQFGSSLTATFQLFVDGLLVASTDIQYQAD